MRKVISILSLATLVSCSDVPKCDNKEAIELVTNILEEHSDSLVYQNGSHIKLHSKIRIKNIVRKSIDSKLNSCECEATVEIEKEQAKMSYSMRENDSGIYVNVNEVSPFHIKP